MIILGEGDSIGKELSLQLPGQMVKMDKSRYVSLKLNIYFLNT